MEQGVCLKGEKSQPFSTAKRFAFNDVYLNLNDFVI